jgi:hypothetical protein
MVPTALGDGVAWQDSFALRKYGPAVQRLPIYMRLAVFSLTAACLIFRLERSCYSDI